MSTRFGGRGFVGAAALVAAGACSAETGSNEHTGGDRLAQIEQPLVFIDNTCSTSEKSKVDQAESIALHIANASLRLAYNNGAYKRWFGTWSSARELKVRTVLQEVLAGWSTFEGDCDKPTRCTDPEPPVAWTNGDSPVHLCDPFFPLAPGMDIWKTDKIQALLHEKVHIVSVVTDENDAVCTTPTDLDCYGLSDALELAKLNPPTKATNNADNYAQFMEYSYIVTTVLPAQVILQLEL